MRDFQKNYTGKFTSECMYYKHGLSLVPEKVKDYIKGKAFIDLGCYVGDSAVVLSEFSPSIIFSFDISEKSLKEYEANTRDLSHCCTS
ncbi:MAG: hypothetical protein LBU10_03140 [Endomicrobium sp.]|nr:hypothetical protein [Endomicrobium sp.]